MIAPLQARDHRLGHLQSRRKLLLRLAGMGAQLQQLSSTPRGERGTVVRAAATPRSPMTMLHDGVLAGMRLGVT